MPIKPINKHLYPGGSPQSKQWKALRASILRRAGNHCEECGVMNHDLLWKEGRTPVSIPQVADKMPTVEIVLTIAHLDHDPSNNEPGNLRALCQRCHNRHDAEHRKHTRRRSQEMSGNQDKTFEALHRLEFLLSEDVDSEIDALNQEEVSKKIKKSGFNTAEVMKRTQEALPSGEKLEEINLIDCDYQLIRGWVPGDRLNEWHLGVSGEPINHELYVHCYAANLQTATSLAEGWDFEIRLYGEPGRGRYKVTAIFERESDPELRDLKAAKVGNPHRIDKENENDG